MTTLVSPWPPQRNGIADYAFEIARAWPGPLDVLTEAVRPAPVREDVQFVRPDQAAAGPFLYHAGNNPDHAFLVPIFLRRPGTVVLHDLTLHYLAQQVDWLLPGFLAAQIRAEHPTLAASVARVGAAGLTREMDHREIRLLGWLRPAAAVIVHSRAAAATLSTLLPGTRVEVVPHFCYLPGPGEAILNRWRDGVRDRVRARCMGDVSFAANPFVLVSLGFPAADKQLGAVMRAIARLPDAVRGDMVLLIAGEIRPGDPDPMRLAAQAGIAGRVRALGFVSETEATELLLVADLVLALRYPTRGESSGAVARALGLGCAVVVSDHGAYAELPDEAAIKLPARADPSEALLWLFTGLAADRSRIVRTRQAAFATAQARDPARIAAAHAAIAAAP